MTFGGGTGSTGTSLGFMKRNKVATNRGPQQHLMNNTNGGNVSFNIESTDNNFSPIASVSDITSRNGQKSVDIVTRTDGGRYFVDAQGRILNHSVALELTAKLRRRLARKNITPPPSQAHAMQIVENRTGVYGELENPNSVDLLTLLQEDDNPTEPQRDEERGDDDEDRTYTLCRNINTGQTMWSDD